MGAPAQHTQTRNPHSVAPTVARGGGWLETPKPRYTQDQSIDDLKSQVDFRSVVLETHEINRANKVRCPIHNDNTPSCHIYTDHFYCFPCGANGDVIAWLKATRNLTTAEAIRNLRERTGNSYLITAAARVQAQPKRIKSAYTVVEAGTLELHCRRTSRLTKGPKALSGRGFTVSDLKRLRIAADGDDAIMPIISPTGAVFALKRRCAVPRGKMRYVYDTPGHGTPAWCSPGFFEAVEVLIIEGELNGMAAWCARPDLGVMGVAGTSGAIYSAHLEGKTVYVYGDGDVVGQEARAKWAQEAHDAGAAKVYLLEPWEMDACDIAGKLGRDELHRRLM